MNLRPLLLPALFACTAAALLSGCAGTGRVPAATATATASAPAKHYHYLTPAVRKAIDRAPVQPHRWQYVVVHASSTRRGGAAMFDKFHRHAKKMPGGLLYHFVIGNGTETGDGEVEVGPRWVRQTSGIFFRQYPRREETARRVEASINVCLVGDFNQTLPTRQQRAALEELVGYLRQRVGTDDRGRELRVKTHKDFGTNLVTYCPGLRFPYGWLQTRFATGK